MSGLGIIIFWFLAWLWAEVVIFANNTALGVLCLIFPPLAGIVAFAYLKQTWPAAIFLLIGFFFMYR